jgi:3-oxoadipate enol-lactonase
MPVAKNGTTTLTYDVQGQGEPLLLVMGHRFPRIMWFRTTRELAEQFTVITYDNRGIGDSTFDGSAFSVRDMAEDAIAVLDAAGFPRAHVFGVSMGGVIAQQIAIHHPDRVAALVLGCTAPHTGSMQRPKVGIKDVFNLLRPGTKGKTAFLYGSRHDSKVVAEDFAVLATGCMPKAAIAGQRKAMSTPSATRQQIAGITAPTLVIHGDGDVIVPIALGQELASIVPGAELVVLEGAGHSFTSDAITESHGAISTFLTKHALESA